MIRRDADEIRVERDEWRLRLAEGGLGVCGLVIVVVANTTAIESRRIAAIGFSVLVLLVVGTVIAHRRSRPELLVIRPSEIGYSTGKELRWFSRGSCERVKVVLNMFGPDILFFDTSGKTVHRIGFNQLYIKELREAFREAGYTVEGWAGPKRV